MYSYLLFGVSTTPRVFSKAMRELVMYWRREGITALPYVDDFMAMKQGFWACVRLARKLESNLVRAVMRINVPK